MTRTPRAVTAVGVVVPARDEAHLVQHCLHATLAALRRLPTDVDRAVRVVAHRCTDDTAAIARAALDGVRWAEVIVEVDRDTVGAVRDLGVRSVVDALSGHDPQTVLLLNTDADSVPDPDWAWWHRRLALAGADAVAGISRLSHPAGRTADAVAGYAAILERAAMPTGHGNVYGANLGVRAGAYLARGGFGDLATGEDHDLWRRLVTAGNVCRYAEEPSVVTSARHHGRAQGGLADLLRGLADEAREPAV